MSRPKFFSVTYFITVIAAVSAFIVFSGSRASTLPPVPAGPHPPSAANQQYVAAIDVARVFGRSQGCAKADAELIIAVAVEAIKADVDPRILAATVAIESACDPMAVSRRGAIGITQIMPKIWMGRFDFTGSINLFNRQDNLRTGALILGGLIKQYGVAQGVRRYQGTGTDCSTCGDAYVPKILTLAGKR